MNSGRPHCGSRRPRLLSLAAWVGAVACVLLLSSPPASLGDIYRWEDDHGTVHFTDDVTTIPPQFRKNSSLLIREAPSVIPSPTPYPSTGQRSTPPAKGGRGPSAEETASRDAEREKEDLVSQVEALRAKVMAKEQHMNAVDTKRSLATNPLRNRFVDQADLDLYEKYRAELPADKARLKDLESQVESIK